MFSLSRSQFSKAYLMVIGKNIDFFRGAVSNMCMAFFFKLCVKEFEGVFTLENAFRRLNLFLYLIDCIPFFKYHPL